MELTKKQKYKIIKKICPNSTECISFGTQSDEIREVFDDFKIPSKLINQSEIKQIGEKSNNGVIYKLKYEINNYTAHTIIKNATDETADNLYYEAFVGWYINSKMKFYPCFVETYDLYKNENERDPTTNMMNDFKLDKLELLFNDEDKMEIEENDDEKMEIEENDDDKMEIDGGKTVSIEDVENDFYSKITEPDKLIKMCKEADKISLNIQYLENVDSLFNTLVRDVSFKKQKSLYDIWNYLYQVYAPLSILSEEYTHYDLHSDNVLIYKVSPNKYTKMIYYYPDGSKIDFNTIGIAKIIDYGRCYFKYNDVINSKNFIENLEKELGDYNKKSSNNMHWDSCGYNSFTPGFKKFDMDSRIRNKSHDLRLVTNVNNIYKHFTKQIVHNVVYNKEYGTPEITEFKYKKRGNKIHNVDEMHEELKQLYFLVDLIKSSSKQIENTHILHGTIECWLDGSKPMVFTPSPVSIPEENRPLNLSEMKDVPISIPKSLINLTVTPYLKGLSSLRKQTRSLGGKSKKRNEKKTRKTRKL